MKKRKPVFGLFLFLAAIFFTILGISALSMLNDKKNQDHISDLPKNADKPQEAALQNYLMTADPKLNRVPSERLYKSFQQKKQLQSQLKGNGKQASLDWVETGSDMGGRTRAILWDPHDEAGTKVWAGAVTGGLWYNNNIYNNASEWQCVNDFWPNLSVSSIVADPLDETVYYAGTGEYETARNIYRSSSSVGIGIWKSIDAGETWEIIPSTEEFKYISDLKIRVEGGNSVLYAGVVSGIYAGANHQSEPSEGLYRSTNDGNTWQQVLPNVIGENEPYAPADLEIGPEGRIFVGTLKNTGGDGGSTILYSDAGTYGSWTIFDDYVNIIDWQPTYNVPDRVVVACAPSDENRVYALVGAGYYNSSNFNYAKGRYILRSMNGGESWTERSLPGGNHDWAKISWHAFVAAVNPTNKNILYVGGKDVWKSTNSGSTWTQLSDWMLMYSGGGDEYVHCDNHTFLYNKNSANDLLISGDGGVFFTSNASSSNPVFQEKNNNYSTLQFYTCAIYPLTGQNFFVGGLQDNGTLLYSGPPLSVDDMIDTGDGAFCFFDKYEPEIMITSTYYNSYKLFINWQEYDVMGMEGTGVFINPADYDSDNNTLYANAVKNDGTYANQLLRISGIPDNISNELVDLPLGVSTYFSHVKVTPFGPDGTTTLLLGTQNGRLFRIENAQNIPQAYEIGSENFPNANISCVEYGNSIDTLLLTFSNYGVPSVWQTFDGGFSWNDISGSLPDMPVRWCIYQPNESNMAMLATEIGVWITDDVFSDTVEWLPDEGMFNVRVDMLKIRPQDNRVLAATHGRGLMHTIWQPEISVEIEEIDDCPIWIFPNPATDFIQVNFGNNKESYIQILNPDGRIVFEKRIFSKEKINVSSWKSGYYLMKISSNKSETIRKFIVK